MTNQVGITACQIGKRCPRCGQTKRERWHLVCETCWQRLPQDMRDELYDAWQRDRGSKRHLVAMRRCIEHLRGGR